MNIIYMYYINIKQLLHFPLPIENRIGYAITNKKILSFFFLKIVIFVKCSSRDAFF